MNPPIKGMAVGQLEHYFVSYAGHKEWGCWWLVVAVGPMYFVYVPRDVLYTYPYIPPPANVGGGVGSTLSAMNFFFTKS